MINRLKEIMERINYWLSFAEAKCAGMTILNLTIILALLGIINDG